MKHSVRNTLNRIIIIYAEKNLFRSVFSTSPSSFRNKEKEEKRSNNRGYTVSNY